MPDPRRFADSDLRYMTLRQSAHPRHAAFGAGWEAAGAAGAERESPYRAGSEPDRLWLEGFDLRRQIDVA